MRFFTTLLLLFIFHTNFAQTVSETRLNLGYSFLNELLNGQGDSAIKYLDSNALNQTSAGQLSGIWRQIEQGMQVGKYQDTSGYLIEENTLLLGIQFEKAYLDCSIVFNDQNAIEGFFFRPPSDKRPYFIPSYADTSAFEEIDFILVSGKYKMPGKLCVPKTKGPHALCILSHGSGPGEMDSKIGPNRVFKDIAYGLASQGIAVFRYSKRTAIYGGASAENPDKITVKEEYLDDLQSAIDTFANDPRFDESRIYLFGHSQGGYLAPRVAKNSDKLSGIILAAAPCRPIDSVALEQLGYLNSIDSTGTYYRPLKDLTEEVVYLHSEEFDLDSDPSWLPLGLNAYYWKDLMDYDPIEAMKGLSAQILIINGEDDYQVNMGEFACWKRRLEGVRHAQYVSFPGLGHGFFSSSNIKGPAQYQEQHSVDPAVIQSIAQFIR